MKSKLIFCVHFATWASSKKQFTLKVYQRLVSYTSFNYGISHQNKLTSREAADKFIKSMNNSERELLKKALLALEQKYDLVKEVPFEHSPSWKQLQLVAISSSIPFVGFGFIDNSIMISAGEYIDLTLGTMFGISTMAAAAFGNMVSDVAGISLAGYVEAVAVRFGMDDPYLSPRQKSMTQTKIANYAGRAVGVIIGCILGMFPLLFKTHDQKRNAEMNK